MPLSASAIVVSGQAVSTVATTAFVVPYYRAEERRTPAYAKTPFEFVAIDVSNVCEGYFINKHRQEKK